jgi:hypothetical protein
MRMALGFREGDIGQTDLEVLHEQLVTVAEGLFSLSINLPGFGVSTACMPSPHPTLPLSISSPPFSLSLPLPTSAPHSTSFSARACVWVRVCVRVRVRVCVCVCVCVCHTIYNSHVLPTLHPPASVLLPVVCLPGSPSPHTSPFCRPFPFMTCVP